MLARRIIPVILMKRGLMVKGERFKIDRVVGNALQAARVHAMRGVDELMILDVTATREHREPDYGLIEELTSTTSIPVTVGGGVSKLEHIRNLLSAGADKICIGTHKDLVAPAADKFGNQCITVSIEAWSDERYAYDAMCEAEQMIRSGAGEILLQTPDRDGTMEGFDLHLIDNVCAYLDAPVIVCGGCKDYEDMYNAFNLGADAVAVGALFTFTDATPKLAAEWLDAHGVEVRL